jgi:hypothetical protein
VTDMCCCCCCCQLSLLPLPGQHRCQRPAESDAHGAPGWRQGPRGQHRSASVNAAVSTQRLRGNTGELLLYESITASWCHVVCLAASCLSECCCSKGHAQHCTTYLQPHISGTAWEWPLHADAHVPCPSAACLVVQAALNVLGSGWQGMDHLRQHTGGTCCSTRHVMFCS